jgi:ribosome recycling factor
MIRILINFTRLARKIHYPIAKLSLDTKNYHHTTFNYFAKAIKKPDLEFEPTLPSIKDVELDMTKKIANLTREFSKLRGGRVSVDMFNDIKIDAYGSKIPLSDIGQVSLKASNKLNISIFDPDLISSASNAIRDCGLGLNPTVEGNNLLVTVPKPSKEARENIVKLANKISEKVIFYILQF